MCQPKSLGGKRCAIHHHGTQAAVQTTSVKTGVDTEDVKTVFSELNKEGKKLPEPSRAEYESYIEKERFLTEIDKTIPERDKNMILKKLNKAKEENTPSGGTFHAWKNLMSTTIQRFSKKAKLIVAGIGIAAVTFGSAGCASVLPAGFSNSNGGSSISVVEGEKITDSLGTYSKVTIDANNPLLDPNKRQAKDFEKEIIDAGYSQEDINAAQKVAVTFAMTEMVDHAAVDLPDTKAQTLSNLSSTYITGNYVQDLTSQGSNLVYTAPAGVQFVRDGKARISSNANQQLAASLPHSGKGITIDGISEVKYRVVPNEASQNKSILKVKINWTFRTEPDANGAWKIAGYTNHYESFLE